MKGFTLLELLTVLTVMTIISAAAVPGYLNAVHAARASEAPQILEAIAHAERRHHRDHGAFKAAPATPTEVPKSAGPFAGGPAWSALGVSLRGPIHYQYEVKLKEGGFEVIARGDLDGDGVTSRFVLDGQSLKLTVEDRLE